MPPASPPNTSPPASPTPLRQLRPSPIRPPPPIALPPTPRSAAEQLSDDERELARQEARWAYYPYPVPRRAAPTGLYHIIITAPSSRTTSHAVITCPPLSPARCVGLGVFDIVVNLPWPSRHPLVIGIVINHIPSDTATNGTMRLTIQPRSGAATDPAALAAQLNPILREIVHGASVAVSRVTPGRRWETGPPRNEVRAIDENGHPYVVAPRRHSGYWPTATDGESSFPTEFGVVATPTGDGPVRTRVRVVSAAPMGRSVSAASGSGRSRGALRNFFNPRSPS